MTLRGLLAEEIRERGPVAFSRYMELALYHPEHGFYANQGAGRRRDFITSPEVGPLFGAIVARALDRWWEELDRPDPFTFVDAGAGPGALARSILRAEPACGAALDYVAVETSGGHAASYPDGVRWVRSMPPTLRNAVVFANELLDNMPFDLLDHRPGRGWTEIKVGWSDGAPCEVAVPLAAPPEAEVAVPLAAPPEAEVAVPLAAPPELSDQDRDLAFRVPVQTRAAQWVADVLATLQRGRLIVVDYAVASYPCPPEHPWLRTYRDHDRGFDPLVSPGSCDITADVDLSALSAVCPPTLETTQAEWLRENGLDLLVEEGRAHWHRHAANPDLRAIAMRSRVHEAEALTDPAGLGGFAVVEWAVDHR